MYTVYTYILLTRTIVNRTCNGYGCCEKGRPIRTQRIYIYICTVCVCVCTVNIASDPDVRGGGGCRTEIMSNAGFPGLGPRGRSSRPRVDKHFKGSPSRGGPAPARRLTRARARSSRARLLRRNLWLSKSGSPPSLASRTDTR